MATLTEALINAGLSSAQANVIADKLNGGSTSTEQFIEALILAGVDAEAAQLLATNISAIPNISVERFGVIAGADSDPVQNSAAMLTAIQWAISNAPAKLEMNENLYRFSDVWPVITKAISIEGAGRNQTYIQFENTALGQCVTVRDAGFSNESSFLPQNGSKAFESLGSALAGFRMRGLTLLGDRSASQKQHGIVFEGNCDFADIDIDVMYFNGRGTWFGKEYNGRRGNFRESTTLNVRTRHCGSVDGTSSVRFELADSPSSPSTDSINLIKDIQFDVVFPYGRGIEFIDSRTTNVGPPMYGIGGKLMLHGRYSGSTSNGALLHIEGAIRNCEFDVNIASNEADAYDVHIGPNSATGEVPSFIKLNIIQPNSFRGVNLVNGLGVTLNYVYSFVKKEALVLGPSFVGPLEINYPLDNLFLEIGSSIQLNGTNAIAIPGWVFNTTPKLSAFMPVVNTNGTGDTIKAAIYGVVGTITRSGSTTLGTDTYTFTPDSASSNFIAAGESFSKFAVSDTNSSKVTGRYTDRPTGRRGVAVSGFWQSDRLLYPKPWAWHIENATGLLRQTYGKPTGDNSGFAYQPIRRAYVGTSQTPSVAGFSLLVANYSSPTTMTNMTGGIDGQVVKVVATNANCTIQHGPTGPIKTKTGANIVMTSAQSLSFVYSADLGYWLQE